MRLMIASDIHGSAFYCRKMVEAFYKEEADRLLLLGDILYHGPRNELPKEYSPKEVITMLNKLKQCIFCVRGNCDTEVDQMVLDFPILADYCVLEMGNRLIYATHGHRYHKDSLPPMQPQDILLHGHTHIPAWELIGNGQLYLNPGSISLPKAESKHSYMMICENEVVWKDVDGDAYHFLQM